MKHVLACLTAGHRRDGTDQTITIIIIIINIYIAPILFSAKSFTMLQKVLDKK